MENPKATVVDSKRESAEAFWAMVRAALNLITVVGFFVIAGAAAVADDYSKATFFLLLVFFIEHFDVWRVRRDREREGRR